MTEKPQLIFMGTPEFAVPVLQALIDQDYPIVAVVTQPDKPQGRGRKLAPPPVKALAERKGLTVLQPARVRDPQFIELFRHLQPEMVIVASFGQILPPEIIHFPPYGCINVHPSLLPRHRGAAPINWTLISGDEVTGVTIMAMDEGVDTGDIILQEQTPVEREETYDHLHDRLAQMGARLLLEALPRLVTGDLTPYPQPADGATYAPRLKKADALIDWSQGCIAIGRQIRGMSSVPGAFTYLDGKVLKIFQASERQASHDYFPGYVGTPESMGLPIATPDGWVYLKEVQLEGKKRLPIHDFLRGYRLRPGMKVG